MKFVVMGLGEIGARLLACARENGGELIGAVDTDHRKVGLDAGRVAGLVPTGIQVVADIRDVKQAPAVVLHATGSGLSVVADQITSCIQHGFNVVSTCEELAFPWRKHPRLAEDLDRACRDHGVTLIGTGINPGFAMDTFVLAASIPCCNVRAVKAVRVVDARTRRLPLRRKIGLGLKESDFQRHVDSGRVGHVGLEESAWMLSEKLTLRADRSTQKITSILEPPASRTRRPSRQRLVYGLRQIVVLYTDATEVVRLDLTMAAGIESRDEVTLDAEPPIHITVSGGFSGDSGTAGVVVNAARQVSAARPGLLTLVDLPLPHARHTPGRESTFVGAPTQERAVEFE